MPDEIVEFVGGEERRTIDGANSNYTMRPGPIIVGERFSMVATSETV